MKFLLRDLEHQLFDHHLLDGVFQIIAVDGGGGVVLESRHRFRSQSSNSAHQKQDEQDQENQAHSPARTITPASAVRPGWENAEQHQNEQNDQYGTY